MLVTNLFIFLGGLAVLLLGANWLVEGASSLAKRFRVSDLVIGLTVVALGTSSPELTVSIYSGLQGASDIALGNVVGSNIFNVLVILGLVALVLPLRVHSNTIWKEIPLSLLAALLLLVFASDAWLDGAAVSQISRTDSLALLGFMAIFLYYSFEIARKQQADELHNEVKVRSHWLTLAMIAGGLLLLIAGGMWLVDGAVGLATAVGMSESVIALTIVAAGTSAPELATSLVAAYRKNADIAVGNVVGSNIFNVFFILGTAGLIQPLGLGNITPFDLWMCVGANAVLLLFALNYTISRLEGALLFLAYVAYMVYLIAD